ncbi:VOC family protein [Chishuiella sp.]|uniref:VOC family protein n=1 Tax=Chishuiella sp. TaxID=1969467 RepID=UPI0028A7AA54|nr:VOC family protein [Chishuiella sp.]
MELRVARHTNDISRILDFYTKIIGFDLLGEFKNHDNYDGIFLGKKNENWHLEFTTSIEQANHYSDEDDCLVFYVNTKNEYDEIIHRIHQNNISIINSKNPYWNLNGVTIKDPDGFNVIISPLKISN